ncbi:MAG: universal stress protein [Thermoanaerobaculia bacterium]
MTPPSPTPPAEPPGEGIRRILIALDTSADSAAALEAAAALAALLEAELEGLFVEEEHLLLLATQAATEVDLLSGRRRTLERPTIERQLRARAARARRALERTAGRLRVRWSFRTAQGRVETELLAAGADLITLGIRGHSPRRPPGSTAAAVIAKAPLPVLVLGRGARLGRTVHVLYDGTPAARRALAIAAELARRNRAPLNVVVSGEDPEVRRRELDELLPDAAAAPEAEAGTEPRAPELPELRVETVPVVEPQALIELLRRRGCGLLVVPRSGETLAPEALRETVRRAHCPVLVT